MFSLSKNVRHPFTFGQCHIGRGKIYRCPSSNRKGAALPFERPSRSSFYAFGSCKVMDWGKVTEMFDSLKR